MPDAVKLITPTEAALLARCSSKTVRRAYLSGALPAHRAAGGRKVLLDESDVIAFFRAVSAARPTADIAEARASDARTVVPALAGGRRPPLNARAAVDTSTAGLRARREQRAA